MIGRVGDDAFGQDILNNFKANAVNTQNVKPVTHSESGTAHIILAEGDNSIVFVEAANREVTRVCGSSGGSDPQCRYRTDPAGNSGRNRCPCEQPVC